VTADVGGGLLNARGTMTVRDCTITGNSVGYGGGGIENDDGSMTVEGSTLADNFGGGVGGGIDNCNSTLTVTGCTFARNITDADGGGGIYNFDGTLTVTGCTFTGNNAVYEGGGIANFSGRLTVSNSTLVGNYATHGNAEGGGIYNAGTLTLSNSIVAGNTAFMGPDLSDLSGPVDSRSGYNLIGDGSGLSGISDGVNHNRVGTAANPIDPLLAPLGNYGGPTQTFALLTGSPALGAGGPGAMLTSPVDATATSLRVDYAAGLAVSSGLIIQIDGEQVFITAVNTTSNTFTVVRGVGGTAVAAHGAGAGLFPATDQRGAPRVVNGNVDIGSYQIQPAAQLVISISGPVSAGAAFTLTVAAYDAYGNVAIGFTGTVTFLSTDPDAQLPQDYSFSASDAGTHDFVTTLYASGSTVTLFVSDSANNLVASVDVIVG
jgi:hypothetical protein